MGELGMGFEGWAHGRAYNAKTEMLPRARFLPPLHDTVPSPLAGERREAPDEGFVRLARRVVARNALFWTDPSSPLGQPSPVGGEGVPARYFPSVPAETCPLTYPLNFTQTSLPGGR